jgi:hypothetical protein
VKGATFGCGLEGRRAHTKELDGDWMIFQTPVRRWTSN